MSITGFLIRVVFLALPGIIASATYGKLIGKTSQKDWQNFREIALFSLLSYVLYGLAFAVLDKLGILNTFGISATFTSLKAVFDDKIDLSYPEIALASLIGLALSLIATWIYTNYAVNKLGRGLRLTNRFNDVDVWDYVLNSSKLGWVYVRDHKTDLTYYGWTSYLTVTHLNRLDSRIRSMIRW